jgi:AcrR family transcriptional regulator
MQAADQGLSRHAQQQRAQLRRDIKDVALRQLAEGGVAALSLRGISRELGVSVGGLYRYYASSADLLTELSADAYAALGDAVARACARIPADQHRETWMTFCRAYHTWARAHPVDYGLIYDTRPTTRRLPAADRIAAARDLRTVGFRILAKAHAAGALRTIAVNLDLAVEPTPGLAAALDAAHIPTDPAMVALTLSAWAAVHGIITLDIAGVLAQLTTNPDDLIEAHLQMVASRVGFSPTSDT